MSKLMEEISRQDIEVGHKLRALRKIRGITLQKLAEDTGMSYSYLSGLENGKHSVSLTNLQRLSAYFDVDLVYFLQSRHKDTALVKRSDLPKIEDIGDVHFESITGTDARDLQISYFVLPPFSPEERHVHMHSPGHEMVVVIEGICFVDVEEETHRLEAGDLIVFASDVEHTVYTEERGAVIVLVSSPPYRGRVI